MTAKVEEKNNVNKIQAVITQLEMPTNDSSSTPLVNDLNLQSALRRLKMLQDDADNNKQFATSQGERDITTLALRILRQHQKIAEQQPKQPYRKQFIDATKCLLNVSNDPSLSDRWTRFSTYGPYLTTHGLIKQVKAAQDYKTPAYSAKTALAKRTEKKLVMQLGQAFVAGHNTENLEKLIYDLEKNKSLMTNTNPTSTTESIQVKSKQKLSANTHEDTKILYPILQSYHQDNKKQDEQACRRLDRSLKFFTNWPMVSMGLYYTFFSIPGLSHALIKAFDLDMNVFNIIGNVHTLSACKATTIKALNGIHNYLFEVNKNKSSRHKLKLFFDWLVFNKKSLFHKLNEEETREALRHSSKNGEYLRRDFKITINRLLRDYGYYVHITGTERKFFDEEGEAHTTTDYELSQEAQHPSHSKHQRAQRKRWLWAISTLSGFLVALGQGVLPAAGFYFSADKVAAAFASLNIPVISSILVPVKMLFAFLAVHPLALTIAIGTIFVSGFITNNYLFKNDSYATLKAFLKPNKKLTLLQKALRSVALFASVSIGMVLAALVLYSFTNLLPLLSITGIPLMLLTGLAWTIAGATLINMPLVMFKALSGKIDSQAYRGTARFVLNFFLPYVHAIRSVVSKLAVPLFMLTADNWDRNPQHPADKWDQLDATQQAQILALAKQRLAEQEEWDKKSFLSRVSASFTKHLAEKLGWASLQNKTLNNIQNISDEKKVKWDNIQVENDRQNLKVKAIKDYLCKQSLLNKTQHSQIAYARRSPLMKIAYLAWNTMRLAIVGVIGMGAFSLLAVWSMTLGWGRGEHLALTDVFHFSNHIADVFTFVFAYAATGFVISMFFGVGIVKLLDQMTRGEACSGYGNCDGALPKHQGPRNWRFYAVHTAAILFTVPLLAALVINAFGNACLSLLSHGAFSDSPAWHLWSNLVHVEASFASLITSFMGSLVGSWFAVREAQANSTPYMSLPLDKHAQTWVENNVNSKADSFSEEIKQTPDQYHGSGYEQFFQTTPQTDKPAATIDSTQTNMLTVVKAPS